MRLQQRVAVVLAQFVVELALGGLQLAVDGLLGLGGKFRRHLLLGAAQDERPQRVGQQAAGFLVGIARRPAGQFEDAGRAEHAGLRNSNSDHSSPRWFSTGVPLSARRWLPRSSRAALADSVLAFLMACASSSTT